MSIYATLGIEKYIHRTLPCPPVQSQCTVNIPPSLAAMIQCVAVSPRDCKWRTCNTQFSLGNYVYQFHVNNVSNSICLN